MESPKPTRLRRYQGGKDAIGAASGSGGAGLKLGGWGEFMSGIQSKTAVEELTKGPQKRSRAFSRGGNFAHKSALASIADSISAAINGQPNRFFSGVAAACAVGRAGDGTGAGIGAGTGSG